MLLTDPKTAYAQEEAYADAADASPIPQLAADLGERAREWRRAADDLSLAFQMNYENAGIAFVGSLTAGAKIMGAKNVADVLRVIKGGGDISLQCNDDGQVSYFNYVSPASPVVVVPTLYRRRKR